jgi:hypothetical protein
MTTSKKGLRASKTSYSAFGTINSSVRKNKLAAGYLSKRIPIHVALHLMGEYH